MVNISERLYKNIDNWRKIDAPEEILNWITNGVPINFNSIPPKFYIKNKSFGIEERNFLRKHISKLLNDGAIKTVGFNSP